MKKVKLSPDEIQKKREEAERKARRGEIDPMQEFAFQVMGQVKILVIVVFSSEKHIVCQGHWDPEARDDGLHVR